MKRDLQAEFQYYLNHQAELAEQYAGKVLVIKDQQVVGVYESDLEAVRQASAKFEPGTFLVQRCEAPGDDSTYQTFHSRVAIQ